MTYGGIPIGKMIEFSGRENSGKTTSALDIVGNAQKIIRQQELNKKVVYIDAEHTLDLGWAEQLGVDTEELVLMRPQNQCAEDILQTIIDLVKTEEVFLVVLDSLPMLISDKLLNEDLSEREYGGIAGVATRFCRNIIGLLNKTDTSLIVINQMRDDFSNPYNIYHTPGGKALKHNFAVRIYFKRGNYLDENYNELSNRNAQNPIGNKVDMRLVKTKTCRPDRRTSFYTLHYKKGMDSFYDTIDIAVELGLIIKSGAWYRVVDPETGEIISDEEGKDISLQGFNRLVDFLNERPGLFDRIYDKVNELIIE
jgi:recombination protein RecA